MTSKIKGSAITCLATDLDRTLFPNGRQPDDGSMPRLHRVLERHRLRLVFVSGRNIDEVREGICDYKAPLPDWAICEVGTRLYENQSGSFMECLEYQNHLQANSPGWETGQFAERLELNDGLRLQPEFRQNPFKLSYFVEETDRIEEIARDVQDTLQVLCPVVRVVASVDETRDEGLLDLLPACATKLEALQWLRQRMGLEVHEIVYAGDSGNDLQPLTGGFPAIVVANATEKVRKEVRTTARENGTLGQIYFATGQGQWNGCYASGILEGLQHHGVATEA